MLEKLKSCEVCPHHCKVNRFEKVGYCRASDKIKFALSYIHNFEEPCISGTKGSGTIFFSNCNCNCLFCQNYEISHGDLGKEISIEELTNLMLEQQSKGVHNINLVTPTIYAYQIIEAIKIAKKNGLSIPIIYNSSGYEEVKTLKDLEPYIDVYLPDLKYFSNEIALKYSGIKEYFDFASKAIIEMYNQKGSPVFDENGIIQKGIIIRHLILPNHVQNSKNVLKWIKENLPDDIYVSVMAQYFPTYKAMQIPLLNRKISKKEYNEVANYLYSLNLNNGYIQELGEHEEEYVPPFK